MNPIVMDPVVGGIALLWFALVLAVLRVAVRQGVRAVKSLAGRAAGQRRAFRGHTRVVDGDTLVVAGIRVRLFGIDAPEMDQAGGDAARRHLLQLVAGAQVRVDPIECDIYGRTVGRTWIGRRDLSAAMVRDGFARAAGFWSWDYVPLELVARWRRRGLWAECRLRGIGDPVEHRRQMPLRRRF